MGSSVPVIVGTATYTAFNVQVRDVIEKFIIRREKAESGPLLKYPIYFFVSNAVFLRQEETDIGRRREDWQGECIGRNGKPPLLILIHWLAGIKQMSTILLTLAAQSSVHPVRASGFWA